MAEPNAPHLHACIAIAASAPCESLKDHLSNDATAGLFAAPLSPALTIQVVLPKHTPMVDVADALTRLATAVKGTWRHDPASGAFIVEGQP